MKYLITENKLEEVALHWMNKNFGPDKLEKVTHPDYPNSIIYRKNGKVVMEQDSEYEDFYFDYDDIWSIFESLFGMEYSEIEVVMKRWLEETFKLGSYTPFSFLRCKHRMLEETFKLTRQIIYFV